MCALRNGLSFMTIINSVAAAANTSAFIPSYLGDDLGCSFNEPEFKGFISLAAYLEISDNDWIEILRGRCLLHLLGLLG